MRTSINIASVSCLFLTAGALAGPDWDEVCDAGSLPSSAQAIVGGGGSLKSIKGTLGPCPPLAGGGPDFEDMYKFVISSDFVMFCAKTVASAPTTDCCIPPNQYFPAQGTSFDTQLWLFKADGTGLLANDDNPEDPPRSRILANSNDGSGFHVMAAGTYYIAVSGKQRIPVSNAGPMFFEASQFEVSGADGPGGFGNQISNWTGPGLQGTYEIVFCQAATIQGIPTVSQWGLIAMAGAMLAGGAILISRRRAQTAAA